MAARRSIAFILCVEAGPLERQTILLADSIRRWAGAFAQDEIHAFRLRAGPELDPATHRALTERGVILHEEVLNRDHHDYVHINTTYAMRWAEDNLSADVIVWADSDMIFLSEPSGFDLPDSIVAAGTGPYYLGRRRGPKSTGPDHPFDPYWQRLYELAGVTREPYMTALTDGKRVRSFWNGGLIVFRRDAGLAHEWLELFELVLDAQHIPGYGLLNVDQLTLAALLARAEAVETLDHRYNHNIGLRDRLPEPQRSWELADMVSVHYHSWFDQPGFLENATPAFDPGSERYRWLSEWLPMNPARELPESETVG